MIILLQDSQGFLSLEVNAHDTATYTHSHCIPAVHAAITENVNSIPRIVPPNKYLLHHLPGILVLKNFLCIGVTLYWISDSDILVE